MWTKEEVGILKERYEGALKSELLSLLPKHSWASIRWKANSLGLFLRKVTIRRVRHGAYVKCETCGKEFYVDPARVNRRRAQVRFCSIACRSVAYRGGGNPFYGKKHSEDFISRQKERFKGRHNEGRPPKRFRFVNGETVQFSMDFNRLSSIKHKITSCEKCGFDDRRTLVLHHVDGNHKNNESNNLIILCPNCHALAHLQLLDGKGMDSSSIPLPPHIGFRRKKK